MPIQKTTQQDTSYLSQIGKQHLRKWKQYQQIHYRSDFNPIHFDNAWQTLQVLCNEMITDNTLNIVFFATGMSPYPEIMCIDKLLKSNYRIGMVLFIDRLYQDKTIVNFVKQLVTESFADNVINNIYFHSDPYLASIMLRRYKIHLFIGFNMNLVFRASSKIELLQERSKINDLYSSLYKNNPNIISLNIVSYEDGSYGIIKEVIRKWLQKS